MCCADLAAIVLSAGSVVRLQNLTAALITLPNPNTHHQSAASIAGVILTRALLISGALANVAPENYIHCDVIVFLLSCVKNCFSAVIFGIYKEKSAKIITYQEICIELYC